MSLYPLKFKPLFFEKIWGGQKIRTILGKDFGRLANCGESWELSGVEGRNTKISNGSLQGRTLSSVLSQFGNVLAGDGIYQKYGNVFPLLIKFIDAARDLSIQVHPDDGLAKQRHNGFGKSEMWYILQAHPDAVLISGFNRETDREEYLDYFHKGKLMDLLNTEKAAKGDVFYLPAGRVHTIGKGLLLAEVQQTSDITYRIYDFDRKDKGGNKRELHVTEALDAIDFNYYPDYRTDYPHLPDQPNRMIKTPFFTTNKLILTKKLRLDRASIDCFKIYIGVGGSGKVAGESITTGEVALVPASLKAYLLEPSGELELLETYIEL